MVNSVELITERDINGNSRRLFLILNELSHVEDVHVIDGNKDDVKEKYPTVNIHPVQLEIPLWQWREFARKDKNYEDQSDDSEWL